jgi:hypothetical protein
MNIRSAKAKGRRLQDTVCKLLLEHYPSLEEDDIKPAIMGESGVDVKLSPAARKKIPFSIECKNQEKLNMTSAWKQTEENVVSGTIPLLVHKKNRTPIMVTLKFSDLLSIIDKAEKLS